MPADAFAAARVARLATVDADGAPHLVPVVFAVDGDEIYFAVDQKPKSSRSLRRLDNIAANPRVSLLVDYYDEDWTALWWVRVDGEAVVVEADTDAGRRAIDALVAKYPQYRDARPLGPAVVISGLEWHEWSALPQSSTS